MLQRRLYTKLQLCALVCVPETSVHQTSVLCSGLCSRGFCTPNCRSVLSSVFQRLILHTKLQLCALVCTPEASAHQTSALCSGLYSRGFCTPNCSSVLSSVLRGLQYTKQQLCADLAAVVAWPRELSPPFSADVTVAERQPPPPPSPHPHPKPLPRPPTSTSPHDLLARYCVTGMLLIAS